MWAAATAGWETGALELHGSQVPRGDARDDWLVARSQHGDARALEMLYAEHFDGIYSYARMTLRDSHRAEDVTQEVFTRLLRGIDRYRIRPGTPFRAWLYRIARNAVIDDLRRRSSTAFDPADLDGLREMRRTWQPPPPVRWLDGSEISILVRGLPAAQREVITLRYLLDLTVEEIADIIGRTPKAVRRLHERGIKTLEDRLAAMGHRTSTRLQRTPMLSRVKPAPILAARRFALACTRRGRG